MRVAVEEIRKRYPNPVKAGGSVDPLSYCTGGAVCLFADLPVHFPLIHRLAEALRKLNPELSSYVVKNEHGWSKAASYALSIITANDAGDFERAWQLVGEALEWKKEGNYVEAGLAKESAK